MRIDKANNTVYMIYTVDLLQGSQAWIMLEFLKFLQVKCVYLFIIF